MRDGTCAVQPCGATKIIGRGLCARHYTEARRNGTLKRFPLLKITEEAAARMGATKSGRPFSPEHKDALSKSRTGKKLSAEHCEKIRQMHLGSKHNMGPLTEKMRLHLIKARAAKGPTRLELAGRTLLDSLGVEFDEQVPIGNHTVDFYVPKIRLVVEADGWFWHRHEAKERSRDAYLLRNPLVDHIVHLTDEQLKPWTPKERWSKEYRPHRFVLSAAA